MANKYLVFILSGCCMAITSCTHTLTPTEYIKWINDPENGLVKENIVQQLSVKVYQRPQKYIQLTELGPEGVTKAKIEKEETSTQGVQYYELVISEDSSDFIKTRSADKEDYMNNLYYFTFNFQQDIQLIYPGKDTLPAVMYHFERAYSLSNAKKFLLAFEDKGMEGDRIIHIDSPVLPSGVVNLYFKNSDIQKASNIALEL